MFHLLPERAWHLFLKRGDDYTEYSMLKEQDPATGYRISSVAFEGGYAILATGVDPNVANLSRGAGDDDEWDLE